MVFFCTVVVFPSITFIDKKNKITASEFDKRLKVLRDDYRSDANYVLMNLMDSHDTDRLSSHIVNVDAAYDKHVGLNDNHGYDIRKPNETEIQTQKLIVLFQMTYLGAPMIYDGDEVGMWGADDPDCRKPMLWDDMQYDDETSHPFGTPRPNDRNAVSADLLSYYKKLVSVRRAYKALSLGVFETLLTDDSKNSYAFLRSYENNHMIVVINNSPLLQKINIPLGAEISRQWMNVMDGKTTTVQKKTIQLSLPAKSGAILQQTQ